VTATNVNLIVFR